MIYIDCEDNDTTLPIYIGQSKDIQKRYKERLTELLTLNRLSYDTYKSYFFDENHSFYEGSFKAAKTIKFLLGNLYWIEYSRTLQQYVLQI